MRGMDRRRFLVGSAAGLALGSARLGWGQAAHAPLSAMEPWREGFLDIHHIATGRGNSVLAILPDGTSLMVDAGAVGTSPNAEPDAMGPARPDGSRRPGEWIGRYAQRHLRATGREELDYFVLTHLHGDHMGDVGPHTPMAAGRDYRLTGVSDVAELVPIRRLIDRGYPNYDYPAPQTLESALNYIRFARSAAQHGTAVERVIVGSNRQIALQHGAAKYPGFQVRMLAGSGEVWTGLDVETKALFPALSTLKRTEYPTENACSIALRLGYGGFRYYIGGT
jgi:hypothetical protein